jgi:MEMO1 family protein
MPQSRRRAVVAGQFYPADPDELRALVDECLGSPAGSSPPSRGALVPHAGLVYSGRCAGAVFARVSLPQTVVILGPNHTGHCHSPGASLWRSGVFETPLGEIAIDEAFGEALERSCDLVRHDPSAHQFEHAIEVELPFIIRRSAVTTIVPLVIAWDDWPRCQGLAAALAEVVATTRPNAWLIASSDMTHYEAVPIVERKDRLALEEIERLDGQALLEVCRREHVSMCGRAPAAIVIETARRLAAVKATVVDYRHSGFVTGTDHSVVGYAGALFVT